MAKDKKLSPYEVLERFFDEGSFTELDAYLKGDAGEAEAVTGFGTVDGVPAFAFAQNTAVCGSSLVVLFIMTSCRLSFMNYILTIQEGFVKFGKPPRKNLF